MKTEKEFDVVGLGVSTMDVLHIVDHFPSVEEVQKALEIKIEGGGPVATAMVAMSRLGAKTAMIDSIGNDWIGKEILEEFKNENVNAEHIKSNAGYSSSISSILVREIDGDRTIVYSTGNSPEVVIKDVPENLIANSKYLHINGRHFAACRKAIGYAKKYGTIVSFDGGTSRFREELKEIVPLSDICIVTKKFADEYTGIQNIDYAAKIILKSGPEIVVITNGLNGSYLYTNDIKGYRQKAFDIENAVDTTGCGDCYHGAFLFGMCSEMNLFDTIKFASAAAALNARKLGGRSALPTFEEVNLLIEKDEL